MGYNLVYALTLFLMLAALWLVISLARDLTGRRDRRQKEKIIKTGVSAQRAESLQKDLSSRKRATRSVVYGVLSVIGLAVGTSMLVTFKWQEDKTSMMASVVMWGYIAWIMFLVAEIIAFINTEHRNIAKVMLIVSGTAFLISTAVIVLWMC